MSYVCYQPELAVFEYSCLEKACNLFHGRPAEHVIGIGLVNGVPQVDRLA